MATSKPIRLDFEVLAKLEEYAAEHNFPRLSTTVNGVLRHLLKLPRKGGGPE